MLEIHLISRRDTAKINAHLAENNITHSHKMIPNSNKLHQSGDYNGQKKKIERTNNDQQNTTQKTKD